MKELREIFFCYRRSGAQTAKLYKRFLQDHSFPCEVWYSDDESYGNFETDIPKLIANSECAVVFLSKDFTEGFLDSSGECNHMCITAHEIVEIIQKKTADDHFRIITINLDGYTLSERDEQIIKKWLLKSNVPANSLKHLIQCNRNPFFVAKDFENEFFHKISEHMLSDEFYRNKTIGNFYLGTLATNADLIVWGNENRIDPTQIIFENYEEEIDFCFKNRPYGLWSSALVALYSALVELGFSNQQINKQSW